MIKYQFDKKKGTLTDSGFINLSHHYSLPQQMQASLYNYRLYIIIIKYKNIDSKS